MAEVFRDAGRSMNSKARLVGRQSAPVRDGAPAWFGLGAYAALVALAAPVLSMPVNVPIAAASRK